MTNIPTAPDSDRWKPLNKGFAPDMEVLTEHGFISFNDLNNPDLLGEELPFNGKQSKHPGVDIIHQPYSIRATGENFPRVATVDPKSGVVTYLKPSRFIMTTAVRRLVRLKGRNLDIICSDYADLLVANHYARRFEFVLATVPASIKFPEARYRIINRFNQNLHGDYVPREGLQADFSNTLQLLPYKHASWFQIATRYPYPKVLDPSTGRRVAPDAVRTELPTFNLDIAPHHTMIVRLGRGENPSPSDHFVGMPIVVGDGFDKTQIALERLAAARPKFPSLTRPSLGITQRAGN